MRDVYRQVVFALPGSEFTWGDVVLAAALRGDWRHVVDRARRAAHFLAAECGPGVPELSGEEVEAAAEAFRYERELVSAEETEAWLARWDLDAAEWTEWIAADLLGRRGDPPLPGPGAVADDLEAAIHAEAVCSGALDRFAHRLAQAAAAAARADETGRPMAPVADGPDSLDLDGLPFEPLPDDLGPRARELAQLERALRASREEPVSPEDVASLLRERRTDWTRVRAVVLTLRSEDAAREALLSIRVDGRPVDAVARDAGALVGTEVLELETLEGILRDGLVAARTGDWVGPVARDGRVALLRVEEKILPFPSEPEATARAEASLREKALAREVDVRVSWRWAT